MSKLKTYRVSWETFRNGYHTFHIKEMTGRNATEVRTEFKTLYPNMAMEMHRCQWNKIPHPFRLTVKPWREYQIELPTKWTKADVWTEQGVCWSAYYDGKHFRTSYDNALIPQSIITKWQACYGRN